MKTSTYYTSSDICEIASWLVLALIPEDEQQCLENFLDLLDFIPEKILATARRKLTTQQRVKLNKITEGVMEL